MSKRRRIILTVLVIDVIIVAIVIAWLRNRPVSTPTPVSTPPPTQADAPAQTPASPPKAEDRAALPLAATSVIERHGTYRGQPFWLRLSASDPEFAGNRKLEVVFTPTAPAVIDGSILHDSPILIVDEHLRVIRWDNRDGATGVLRQIEPDGYLVVREKKDPDSEQVQLLRRTLPQPLGWPLELAPLLAILADGETWTVPVYDFWGPRVTEHLTASRAGDRVVIAGTDLQWSTAGLTGGDLDVVLSTTP